MAITYYYPEGPLGPICDLATDDLDARDAEARRRRREGDGGDDDGRDVTYGPVDYGDMERVVDGPVAAIISRRCRIRTLSDGTKEYYDCVDDLLSPIGAPPSYPLLEPQYNWPVISTSPWGLDDNFEPLLLSPIDCSPFDADINIIPVKFFKANGTFVEKILTERSSPPTFAVRGGGTLQVKGQSLSARFILDGGSQLQASFKSDGTGISVTGSGTATITLDFEWDDQVNVSGRSVGSLTIAGQTFTQTSSSKGSITRSFSVTGGQEYLWTITGQAPTAGYRIKDGAIQWDDNAVNGFDKNSEMVITSLGSSGIPKLRVEGSGSSDGDIGLQLEWDDNPSDAGTALGTVTINGVSLTQTSGRRKGKTSATISVTPGVDYPINISGNPNGYTLAPYRMGFYDGDGDDLNAKLTITSSQPSETEFGQGAWSRDGNAYGVWVNPEVCTLPTLQQTVTYFIDIPETDTYTITGGADDVFQVFLNDSTTPIIGGVAGIFSEEHETYHTGSYTPPYAAQTTLNEGVLKMVVTCTNGATELTANGDPIGKSFQWFYNPGGWYIKICRGDACFEPAEVPWVHSGPDAGGDWGEFMDKYAAYPSNGNVLLDTDHSTAYNINVPYPGDYILEWGMDDDGSISLDGTVIVSSGYEPNSQTYTISNLSAGPHTIGVTIRNNGPSGDWVKNPGGIAWTLTAASGASSNALVSFDSNGNLVTNGDGTIEVSLSFEWDDNPSTAGTALGTVNWSGTGLEFTQGGSSSGSSSATATVNGNTTYNIQVFDGTGGFEVQNNGQKICFFDNDGDDCNAEVTIGATQGLSAIIASSLDFTPRASSNNLIWHTRKATGYKFTEI